MRRLTEPARWQQFVDQLGWPTARREALALQEVQALELIEPGEPMGPLFLSELRGDLLPLDERHDLHLFLGALAAIDDVSTWQQVLEASTNETAWRRAVAAAVLPRFRERQHEAARHLGQLARDVDERVRTEAHMGLLWLSDPSTGIRWALASFGVGPNPVDEDAPSLEMGEGLSGLAGRSEEVGAPLASLDRHDPIEHRLSEHVLAESWRQLRDTGSGTQDGRLERAAELIARWLPDHLAAQPAPKPRLEAILGEARAVSRTSPE